MQAPEGVAVEFVLLKFYHSNLADKGDTGVTFRC